MEVQYSLRRWGVSPFPPPLPPLLLLPPELIEKILDNLKDDPNSAPFLLRRTHRLFCNIISPADVRGDLKQGDGFQRHRFARVAPIAEDRPELFPQNYLACLSYLRFLPVRHFTNDAIRSPGFDRYCTACATVNTRNTASIRNTGIAYNVIARRDICSWCYGGTLWPCSRCRLFVMHCGMACVFVKLLFNPRKPPI